MKTKLFVAMYNANVFAKTNREKRVELIKGIAKTNVLNPVSDEGQKQVKFVVEALAQNLNAFLQEGLEQVNPEYDMYDEQISLPPIEDLDDGEFNLSEKESNNEPVPRTLPVEEILVDSSHFWPQGLTFDQVVEELLVFKDAGVKTGVELVDQYLDLF